MPNQPKPKKPAAKQVTLSKKRAWRKIINEVEKEEIPIHVLRSIVVHLKDGTEVPINIQGLLAAGMNPKEIEAQLNQKLEELDQYIQYTSFFINTDIVEQTVQAETDKLLSRLNQ